MFPPENLDKRSPAGVKSTTSFMPQNSKSHRRFALYGPVNKSPSVTRTAIVFSAWISA
ncbi:hypothetical protein CEXT_214251, partial [Caerostris extrusa]